MLKLYWKNYLYRLTVILPLVLLLIVSVLAGAAIFQKDIEYTSDQMRLYSSSSFENGYVLNYRSGLANEFAFPEFDISLYVNNDMQERLPLSCVMELNETDYTDASLVRRQYSTHLNENEIEISTATGDGVDNLKSKMLELTKVSNIPADSLIITNERHKDALVRATSSINQAVSNISEDTLDLVSIDIKQAYIDIGEITGNTTSEDIIDQIFKKFCLGK